MIRIVVDPLSLARSAGGSVTGRIFLRGPNGDFPNGGWSDFPAVILISWIEGLRQLSTGERTHFRGLFMEGPVAFIVDRGVGDAGRIAWGTRESEVTVGIVQVPELLQSAVAAGRAVAAACRDLQWVNADLEALDRAIAAAGV